MAKTMEKLTIDERIKILHGVIDELKGSTKIEFEVEAHFIDTPGIGRDKQVVKVARTGETTISIIAYDPKKDTR